MSSPAPAAEEIILVVPNVHNRKTEGTIYLMAERFAWAPVSGTAAIRHSFFYSSVKMQKISPERKDRVQLQLVLHDASSQTFHFNPTVGGRDAAMRDRALVSEKLQELLPRFKMDAVANPEISEKTNLLQRDPALYQLYKDLVVAAVISPEEFWANRNHMLSRSDQETGISSAFFNVKPVTEGSGTSGSGGVTYNLTVDIIESIFKTYPAVRRRHLECVPTEMTESVFWTQFFQSHYFHRDKLPNAKDVFASAIVEEPVEAEKVDADLDLGGFLDTCEEPDVTPQVTQGSRKAAQMMIRRFNEFSGRVLEASGSKKRPRLETSAAASSFADLEDDVETELPQLNVAAPDTQLAVTNGHVPDTEWREKVCAMRRALSGVPNVRAQLKNPNSAAVMESLGQYQQQKQVVALDTFPDAGAELPSTYVSAHELLRHFWSCFPPRTPAVTEKLVRLEIALKQFQAARLTGRLNSRLSEHLRLMLKSAHDKYDAWQLRVRK